jgi:hypothetical protein
VILPRRLLGSRFQPSDDDDDDDVLNRSSHNSYSGWRASRPSERAKGSQDGRIASLATGHIVHLSRNRPIELLTTVRPVTSPTALDNAGRQGRQDKTGQDKTRQDSTRLDWTNQDQQRRPISQPSPTHSTSCAHSHNAITSQSPTSVQSQNRGYCCIGRLSAAVCNYAFHWRRASGPHDH